MSKLFDEEEKEDHVEDPDLNESVIAEPEDDDEEFVLVKFKRDKIFDNDYNTGNLDFEEYTNLPKVDVVYSETNLEECYDSLEYARRMKLENLVDEFFKNTEFGKIFASKKKIPKQILPQVFVSIREQFKAGEYTGTEIFTNIADYFGINYEVLYENIPSVYRAELVRELDEKYGVLKRKGVKRLF